MIPNMGTMRLVLDGRGVFLSLLYLISLAGGGCSGGQMRVGVTAFGEGGQVKMIYDRRQRPQAVCLGDRVHIVFNGGGQAPAKGKSKTRPMAVTYDRVSREFSQIVTLGGAGSDHHHAPVIWADRDEYLHVLYGCHRTPGTHVISKASGTIDHWDEAARIAEEISYPTFFRVSGGRELIYYRTAGHTSSWTYRISVDEGKTWGGPKADVTDMDCKGRFEWSSYHSVLPSGDGRYLHVAFVAYDDNKNEDPNRYFNPRYGRAVSNEWKYNLYYLKIDLETGDVTNFDGEPMDTPIDIDQANAKCRIWDTQWRGAGLPPTIALDKEGNPAFLHVLSGDTLREHWYYYVRRVGRRWEQTAITQSNHQWNSCHLARDSGGLLHAYVLVGDEYLDTGGFMDRYGGGRLEQWVSGDDGTTWERRRVLTRDEGAYRGWKYNNVQPVTRPDGSCVEGMLLFYGWNDEESRQARAFLVHEDPQ